MFTGLIEAKGRVAGVHARGQGLRVEVDTGAWGHVPEIGASISVNGVCLTVAEFGAGGVLCFDLVPETLAKTTAKEWRVGREVNLEHAATVGTFLGGHVVQGHVDGVGEVVRSGDAGGGGYELRIRAAREIMQYIVPKGSITIDGVSLTLADVAVSESGAGEFGIALIPVTLEKTTLGVLVAGGRVNLECDVIAKTVVHFMQHYKK